jgi:hypothetical protein
MDAHLRSVIAGLLLGGSYAFGGASLVSAALYGLTRLVARVGTSKLTARRVR